MEGNEEFRASDHLSLIWPEKLIAELARARKTTHFALPLAVVSFVLASILALVLGPLSLILLALTEDVAFIDEVFTPTVLRIAILTMGVIAVVAVAAMVQVYRERPARSLMTSMFGLGTILIGAVIWLGAFAAGLPANHLSIIFVVVIIATLALAKVTSKVDYIPEQPHIGLTLSLASVLAFAVVEAGATGVFLLNQNTQVKQNQAELDAAAAAMAAARVDGVPVALSDVTYALCEGRYNVVYLVTGSAVATTGTLSDAGIFECYDSHRVYSVSGPITYGQNSVTARAFYFGVTSDPLVSKYFTADLGVKYLYRDLLALGDRNHVAPASELVLLVPAPSEEVLVNRYLEPLLGFVNNRDAENPLRVSIFYNSALNTVNSTRDYILIAAVGTVAMLDYLPGGDRCMTKNDAFSCTDYLNDGYGTYAYAQDQNLAALTELGLSPLLYSSQTIDAINSKRHITLTLERLHTYTEDELRELLYASFTDPPEQ